MKRGKQVSSRTGNYDKNSPSCSHKVVYKKVGPQPAPLPVVRDTAGVLHDTGKKKSVARSPNTMIP